METRELFEAHEGEYACTQNSTTSLTIEYSLITDEDKVSFARTLSDIQGIDVLPIPSENEGDRYERFIEGCT